VIVLNGTSSSGKTTLATNLQARLVEQGQCWIVIGLDDVIGKLPSAWVTYRTHVGAHADEGVAFELVDGTVVCRIGPLGEAALAAYRGSVAAAARAGLNVIVDEVLLSEADWKGWQSELAGLDVTWVRVDCALDVLQAREQARGDRMAGLAASQFDVVHLHPGYDTRVDTAADDADTAAERLYTWLTR
jgi:chloramphenicol 3-O phosphotransferase